MTLFSGQKLLIIALCQCLLRQFHLDTVAFTLFLFYFIFSEVPLYCRVVVVAKLYQIATNELIVVFDPNQRGMPATTKEGALEEKIQLAEGAGFSRQKRLTLKAR